MKTRKTTTPEGLAPAPCSGLNDPMHELHPDASSWRIELLNEAMAACYVERVFEDDDYRLRIGTRIAGWMKVKGATDPVYLDGEDVVVWTMDYLEELDSFIAMLTKLRGSVNPRQNE